MSKRGKFGELMRVICISTGAPRPEIRGLLVHWAYILDFYKPIFFNLSFIEVMVLAILFNKSLALAFIFSCLRFTSTCLPKFSFINSTSVSSLANCPSSVFSSIDISDPILVGNKSAFHGSNTPLFILSSFAYVAYYLLKYCSNVFHLLGKGVDTCSYRNLVPQTWQYFDGLFMMWPCLLYSVNR